MAIDHVQREDAGVYTLYARTKNGETARRDIELIVEDRSSGEDPPIFLRRLSDLSVKVGTRTRLLVEIRSSTDVKVSGRLHIEITCLMSDLTLQDNMVSKRSSNM